MKILVTGATGKVGGKFVPRLLLKEHDVRILVHDETKATELARLGAEVVVGDINHPDTLPSAVEGVDTIVHLAAYFRTLNDDEGVIKTNHTGTIALAHAAMNAQVGRFVFVSTGMVYGSDNPCPADETYPRTGEGLRAYPASKLAAENDLLKLHEEANWDVRILRLGFVYGEGDEHLREAIPLFKTLKSHPAARIHLVHHLDVAQALTIMVQGDGLNGESFNVADDAPISRYEIAKLFGQEKDAFDPSIGQLTTPFRYVMDISKIRTKTSFRPLVPSYYMAHDLGIS